MDFTQKVTLNAHVSKDLRGLGLVRVYVSMHDVGYAKYARVNTEGGLTYIVNRLQGAVPNAATLILSEDEARIINSSLSDFLYGPGWMMAREEYGVLRERTEKAEKENAAMRKGKKKVESELRTVREELNELRKMRSHYEDVIDLVRILGRGSVDGPDCE